MNYILGILILIGIEGHVIKGEASYYSDKFEGRRTASGAIFKQNKLTAASNKFKLGDSVRVTNIANGNTINVLINDRMSYNGRVIDLSRRAADSLDFIREGVTKVKIELL